MNEIRGLNGSTVGNMARSSAAEYLGTFALVFFGTGVAVHASLGLPIAGPAADSLTVALVFGATLMVMVYTLGHISGCHLNPAVTIGLLATKQFPAKYALVYIVSQSLGALTASLALRVMYGSVAMQAKLGATQPVAGVGDIRAFAFECVGTYFLVLVIMAVATDERAVGAAVGLAIGFMLFIDISLGGPITGGGFNSARSLAPMIVSGNTDAWWVYLLAPQVGGYLGAKTYQRLLAKAVEPSEAESA